MESSDNMRITRSRAKHATENEMKPEDSASQVRASSICSVSTNSSTTGRSKEQLELDISALEIQMSSHEKRARLQKAKLDIELDIEQNELQTQMDIARRERELLKAQERQSSSYVNVPPAQTPEQEQRKEFEDEVTKMIGDCYAFLGTGKVDGTQACRVYTKTEQTEKLAPAQRSQKPPVPVSSSAPVTRKQVTKPKERPVLVSRPVKAQVNRDCVVPQSKIGYFPSPSERNTSPSEQNRALEDLYRQQMAMIGAMQAPRVELLEFNGDPMAYHEFIRSFEENVEKVLTDDGARLARLVQLCKGEAGRAIKCCNLMDPAQGYAKARRLLKQRFGDKYTITELWIKRLNEGGTRVNLQEYSDELLDCYESMKALGALAEMDAQRNLLSLITRLPMHLQNKWQDHVFDLKTKEDRRPTLRDVLTFVQRAAAVVSDPVYGSASMKTKRAEKFTTKVSYAATADVQCPVCNDGDHSVSQCEKFLAMGPSDRLDTALRHQVCFMCMTPGHVTRECTNPVKCQAQGCGQRHATVLHEIDWQRFRQMSRERKERRDSRAQAQEAPEGHHVSSHHVMGSKVALPFLLVKVTNPETGTSVKTYALLDSGSNVSLCTESLLKTLGAKGRIEKMSLTTLEKENSETAARVVSLRVSSFDGSGELAIPHVFARPNLRLSSSNLITEAEVQRWPHLRDLPLHHAEIDEVTLLIGQDCPEALMPLTVVPGSKGEPYAIRSILGWTVSGPVSSNTGRDSYASHYISSGELLQDKVDRFWKLESSGIYDQEKGTSIEDKQVMALWDEKVKFTDGHYVLPIPFKSKDCKLYDPLGLASPFVLIARRIVQNLCQEKIGWDDPIPEKERKQWEQWISGLQDMKKISVPRCVQPFPPVQVELHHFSDASEVAYGVVSYLRVIAKDGRIECTLVMAKSRLAPLKRLTLPRLELQAATLAARQNALLRKELGLDLGPPTYWTDSTIVLQYISNTTARYHTFVANRVAEIQNATNVKEWRHVPTRENPADDASRGVSASDLSGSRWVHGPAFLKLPPEQWPSTPVIRPLDEAELEVKKAISFSTQALDHQGPIDKLIDGITNWMQLLRTIACFQLIPEIHRSKIPFKGPLEAEHLQRAEKFLVKYVQRQCYLEEINAINQGRSIPISSPLIRLRPVLYEGTLVVPGRISHAKVPSYVKRPVVLSSRHPVVESLCRYVHEKTAHSGRNYVLAELRRNYWVVGAASLVKKVIRTCVTCRRRDARPCQQREADLPPDRMASYEPPFTNVGVDYFAVKRGRGREKRYGCLFTCLTTRAIHVETAETMDTDSFINCLYRFMARRGEPQLIRSDNGTNFVGAERELRKELEAWNQDRIHEVLSHRGISWLFNPPAASHMGGVWERQIRSVRRVLFALMTEQVPTSEMLTTLLVIAEGIVNNRPLTPASDDPKDLEPLTPNHLLIHRPVNIPPGLFNENDMYHRKKWRQVQYLADVFWKRWTREYLSSLVQRTKWHGTHRNVQENDLVLVISSNTPRNSWPVGRIIETYKGQDDLVRSARVRLRDSELVRPIRKLCVLEETQRLTQDNG